jgi:amino acid adenylation domain-containing protein
VIEAERSFFSDELSAEERELLDQLLSEQGITTDAGEATIEPLPEGEAPPLSFAQRRLWFLDRLVPGRPLYNIPAAVRFRGDLDGAVLARCLSEIVRRHEVIRTRFTEVDGQPLAVVEPARPLPLPVIDLSGLSADARDAEEKAMVGREARRPFDLGTAPLLRATLVTLDDRRHLVLLTMHHVASDGWSLGVLVRELGTLYRAFSDGAPSPLPELGIQYGDFASWQLRRFEGEALQREVEHWRERLAGAPVLLDLPTDRPRSVTRSFRGGRVRLVLSADVTDRLGELARDAGGTLFMGSMAVFAVLLSRYTGQDDLLVGTPIAGRDHSRIEPLIGFFVNSLALRIDLSDDPSFRQLLARVVASTLEAYEHQELPFDKVVESVQPERALGHMPLFQALLVLQNAPGGGLSLPSVELEPVPVDSEVAKLDLTVSLTETAGGLVGEVVFDRDLFDDVTARRLAHHLMTLGSAIVSSPEAGVGTIDLLSVSERWQMVGEWNDTGHGCPQEPYVHELFSSWASRRPDAPAIGGCGGELSYGEVESLSNALAHHLRSLGVGPEVLVAVALERTAWRVVAVVAVLKAGGAYVSLDPTHPPERLSYLLSDAGARVVLTEERHAARVETGGARVLSLDGSWEGIEGDRSSSPAVGLSPSNLAYVVYTSGSTGRPKGVATPHRGLMNLVRWHDRAYGVGPEDRATQITSPAFDASVLELWSYLAAGASVHVPEEETRLSPEGTVEWWRREGITVPCLTTPLAEGVLESGAAEGAQLAARALILGGDRLRRRPGPGVGFRVMNHYGPSEYSVTCTVSEVGPEASKGLPTIGRAIDNTSLYVLDRSLSLVPVGVVGELFLGGIGLARGYLERPGLTAEKFLPHPFASEPGARVYRTGDLVRYREDGELEFLGRLDTQVKVRGLRIELGEVESVLSSHPAVREAAVEVRERRPGDPHLVAYLVARPEAAEEEPSAEALGEHLRERLPVYMVPSAYRWLEALPLSPNGKIDRRALPEPEWPAAAQYVAPRTPVEELVAGQWAELLGLERVGAADDFFDLGGHSLLATRVVSRLRDALGVELPLRTLFEESTLSGFAAVVERAHRNDPAVVPPPIAARRGDGPPRASFAQQRLWFLHQLDPSGVAFNVPSAAHLRGPLDRAALLRALSEIVRRHETLRTTIAVEDNHPVQVIAPPGPSPSAVVALDRLPAEARRYEIERLAREQARTPFDLARGPLLRLVLVRSSDQDHFLAFTFHHVVSDGWSVGIFLRELEALYRAFAAGRPSPLRELEIQYGDFAEWERDWLRGEVLERLLAFWRDRLAGAPAPLELPADRPRPAVWSGRGATRSSLLSRDLVTDLRRLSRRHDATLFMTVLAGFQVLLSRYSGRDDMVLGIPVAGRGRLRTEGMIGFFVNTLALRCDLGGSPKVAELLGRVRNESLAAFAHEELSFDRVVEEVRPDRSLSTAPLFQVVFAMQQARRPEEATETDLVIEPAGAPTATAKVDLTLSCTDLGDDLVASFEYATDLFEPTTVARLGRHLKEILRGVADDPAARVEDLPLLTAAERLQALIEWNDSAVGCPQVPLVHELFAGHAARRPDAPAITTRDAVLTYGELDRRANRLAHRLRRLGVGPESLVALCTGRTPERVVGVVAVLKAGGAYVSLDPTHPPERLAFQLGDAGAAVVLTEGRFAGALPEIGATVVRVDRPDELAGEDGTAPPWSALLPSNLAYVVYTSGSTGRPKGVMIPHRGLMNLVRWHGRLYGVGPEDRGTQVASPAFDASIWELWPYLAAGSSVHVPDEEVRLSSARMVAWWREQKVTVAYLMTPLAEGVLEEPGEDLRDLATRALIIGGDRLRRRPDPAAAFRLMNHYGPAEYSVTCTVGEVAARNGHDRVPNIGRTIDNTRIYLLDRKMRPVPVGVPGELYVTGIGLARGYLSRPGLTADRFVPDPMAEEPGACVYRTGDLVRTLPDGELEFLGRLDHQVKLRGLRIELGEIEAVLGQSPDVREAAVLVRERRPGDPQLVAYVVPSDPEGFDPRGLDAFLADRLPAYMVPSAYSVLPVLPLSPNGKIDRDALPEPDFGSDREFVAPRNPAEEVIAELWRELLGVDRIGVDDDFFALGGHSLLATRLVHRIRDRMEIDLPLRSVFENPTVAGLARAVRQWTRGAADATPLLAPVGRGRPLPLSYAQWRVWLMDRVAEGSAAYNTPTAFWLDGALDLGMLAGAARAIIRRHEILRTRYLEVDGAPVQLIEPSAPLPMPVIDLSALPDGPATEEIRRLAHREAHRPFDLTRVPLLRLTAIRVATEHHAILATMHHIASDGWSMGIVVGELSELYTAAREGRPAALTDLPVQYADYAVWQRRLADEGGIEEQLEFWRRRLAGAPGVLELPIEAPRRASVGGRAGQVVFSVPPISAGPVLELGRRHGATPFMTLLAAFSVLLARWTGQDDLLIGTDLAGRNLPETEGIIGFFVNNLVLRVQLADGPSFEDLLDRVRKLTLEAYENQDVPFDMLVRDLRPERTLERTPLFQVLFVLQNNPPSLLDMPGLEARVLDSGFELTKFDLALFLRADEGRLNGVWRFREDLLSQDAVERLAERFETVLESIGARPEASIQRLEVIREMKKAERAESKIGKLRALRSRPRRSGDPVTLVDKGEAAPGASLPWLYHSRTQDLDPVGWAQEEAEEIREDLLKHGAILFRGFGLDGVPGFEAFAGALCGELFAEYGDLPKEEAGEKVYHSTPYPKDKTILFHNESSHMHRWPRHQFFYSVTVAPSGGETPIVDCREVYRRLDPELARRFEEKGLLYVRNFLEGFDVSWQDFFRTSDRGAVERFARAAGMELSWKGDGLETRQHAPAVIRHPVTGEPVFFNQIQLHHPACLEADVRESLSEVVGMDEFPRNVMYGDGTPIEDSVVEEVAGIYWNASVALPWQEGDVIMVDNMLVAHARNPFSGPRKIVVAMGDLFHASEL